MFRIATSIGAAAACVIVASCALVAQVSRSDEFVSARMVSAPVAGALPAAAKLPVRKPVEFARAEDGLFYLTGRVEGVPVRFLVDTGASVVVLSRSDAERARVAGGGAGVEVQTAGGSSAMHWAQLGRIEIAGQMLGQIKVAVSQDDLGVSLLGVSLLSRLGPLTLDGDRLVLHAKPDALSAP